MRPGAAAADAVIHAAFIHDFANHKAACEIERHAIKVMGTDQEVVFLALCIQEQGRNLLRGLYRPRNLQRADVVDRHRAATVRATATGIFWTWN